MEKKKDSIEYLKYKIRNRESIAKITICIILFAVIAYKLAISNFTFDLTNFNFTDLLSLILAIFAISLSVAFYFKATDTSNKFYDNTFKFTKDISEILGRIEAGFGERLKHLDEGYSGLVNKFDSSKGETKSEDIENAKLEIEKEKEQLYKKVEEKNELLNDLMTKAHLDEKEKEEFTNKIHQREEQIDKLNTELQFIKRRVRRAERSRENEIIHSIDENMRTILAQFIVKECDVNMILEAPTDLIMRRVKLNPSVYSESLIFRLINMGFLSEKMNFTESGVELLRSIARRF